MFHHFVCQAIPVLMDICVVSTSLLLQRALQWTYHMGLVIPTFRDSWGQRFSTWLQIKSPGSFYNHSNAPPPKILNSFLKILRFSEILKRFQLTDLEVSNSGFRSFQVVWVCIQGWDPLFWGVHCGWRWWNHCQMGCTAPFLLGTARLLFKVADLICILTGRAVCKWIMTVLHEWVNTSHCSTVNRSPHPLFNGLWVAHPLAPAHSMLGCRRFEMLCVLRWECGIAAEVLDWEWENLDSSWDPDCTSLRVYLVTFPLWALVSPSLKGENCSTGQGSF